MIWELSFWKEDLLKRAEDLRRRRAQRRWPEVSLAKLEQALMLGFFSVRKLIEARKLSDHLVSREVQLLQFPPVKGARVQPRRPTTLCSPRAVRPPSADSQRCSTAARG